MRGDRICLIGWSQGGLVATAVAGRSGAPKAVALWAAVADPALTFGSMFGADVIAEGMRTGDAPLVITLPNGAVTALKQGYFDQMQSFNPLAEIAAYAGPLFVAHGTLDTVVVPKAQSHLIAAHRGQNEAFVRAMDHCFNVSQGPEMLDEMVWATISFFEQHGG